MKDYDNLIIKRDDPRYGKLGHLWKRYNYSTLSDVPHNIVTNPIPKSWYYFIPNELVLTMYETTKTYITPDKIDELEGPNWVQQAYFKKLIKYTCNLTDQEYFDLLVLRINDVSLRPKCAYCGTPLEFKNVIRGYGSNGRLVGELLGKPTCSQECLQYFKHSHPEIYGETGLCDPWINAKTKRSWFLNNGELSDECYLYITTSRDQFKYGVTSCIEYREHTYNSFEGGSKSGCRIIFQGTRLDCANLEYQIKLELNQVNEYIPYIKTMGYFRMAFWNAIKKLQNNEIQI